jgi:hypothetical protein
MVFLEYLSEDEWNKNNLLRKNVGYSRESLYARTHQGDSYNLFSPWNAGLALQRGKTS